MKIYTYIIGILMILFSSCQKEEDVNPVVAGGSQSITDELTVNSTQNEYSYQLREKSAWTAVVESGDWLKVVAQGSENEMVKFSYEPIAGTYPDAMVTITHKTGTVVKLTVKYEYVPNSLDRKVKIMQLDLWDGGTKVDQSLESLVEEIVAQDADIVTLSDINDFNVSTLLQSLSEKGMDYNSSYSGQGDNISESNPTSMLLSKYEISNITNNEHFSKVEITLEGVPMTVYSVNLSEDKFAWHLPRGYNGGYGAVGSEWAKAEAPVTDIFEIYKKNNQSERITEIEELINDINDNESDNFILVSGNFNEPSYLDWTSATSELYGHNGVVYDWDVSVKMSQAGLTDTYRELYPSAVTHPGFTYPAGNSKVNEGVELSIAKEADERERLDYIYFSKYNDRDVRPENMSILGDKSIIVNGNVQEGDSEDSFVKPESNLPGNHKGIVATFLIPIP